MYQCFHCLENKVVWDNDYNYDDLGYDGDGIVHKLHCCNCGAEIEYKISLNKDDSILKEIMDFCESCPSSQDCPEDECVLYRIEKIIEKENDNG